MSHVEITLPANGQTIHATAQQILVASGWATDDINSISGVCTDGTTGTPLKVLHIAFNIHPAKPTRRKWCIVFKAAHPGLHTLYVTGQTKSGTTTSATPSTFTVRFAFGIGITWPDPGDLDISAYQDDFAPYGDLDKSPLLDVHMTDDLVPPNTYYPSYSYGDYTTFLYWTAQFGTLPSLPSGHTYTLTVIGGGGTQTLPGLIIS
jgi:hypothetical protein